MCVFLLFFLLTRVFSQSSSCDVSSILYNGTCHSLCPKTNPISPDCIYCGENCEECAVPLTEQSPGVCKRCLPLYYLYNSSICVKTCPENLYFDEPSRTCSSCEKNVTFRDQLNRKCVRCPENCSLCGWDGCEVCDWNFIAYNTGKSCCFLSLQFFNNQAKACENCSENCDICDLNGACLRCNPPFRVNNVGCCVDGFWWDAVAKTCEKCQENCKECVNPWSCKVCRENTQQSFGNCCPKAMFYARSAGKCENCSGNCEVCENSTKCFKCSQGNTYLSNEFCCAYGEFWAKTRGKCEPCAENCRTCASETQCLSCSLDFSLSNGFCCRQREFFSTSSKSCQVCSDKNCVFCENSEVCKLCDGNFTLSNGVCCAKGEFFSTNAQICTNCPKNCAVCPNETHCAQCMNPYAFDKTREICCEIGSFFNETKGNCEKCAENCEFCRSESLCTSCAPGFLLQNSGVCAQDSRKCYFFEGNCVEECPKGYFSQGNACRKCSEDCEECEKVASFCVKCAETRVFFANECVISCPFQTFFEETSRNCFFCAETCYSCFGEGSSSCFSCNEGYFLKGTRCEKLENAQKVAKTLDFALFEAEAEINQLKLRVVFNEIVSFPNFLNISKLLRCEVLPLEEKDYVFSLKREFSDNKSLLLTVSPRKSLRNPRIRVSFNEFSRVYLRDEFNKSFIFQENATKTLVLAPFLRMPATIAAEIQRISLTFHVIFCVILLMTVISWLFNPRRASIFWYIIDSLQFAYFCLFLHMPKPRNLTDFFEYLSVFNVNFFTNFGCSRENATSSRFYACKLRVSGDFRDFLISDAFLCNGANAISLVFALWAGYFAIKAFLGVYRFENFENHQAKAGLLRALYRIHTNVYFSFNLRVSFFFMNVLVFFAIFSLKSVDFRDFAACDAGSLVLALLSVIYHAILLYKCYEILNNPLIFNDLDEKNHYLTLFKDINCESFASRTHHLVTQCKKIVNCLIICLFGEFPAISLSFLALVQGLAVLRYARKPPFLDNFINLMSFVNNLCTFAFVCGLFHLYFVGKTLEAGEILEENDVKKFVDIGYVCISLIFMLEISYLCIMGFIFFETCAKNLDCICHCLMGNQGKSHDFVDVEESSLKEPEKNDSFRRNSAEFKEIADKNSLFSKI